MIVETSSDPAWLSNSYLVADRAQGIAAIIDTGAPPAPLLAAVDRLGVRVEHVLCTHHHPDHTQHNTVWRERFGCSVAGPTGEVERVPERDRELSGGERIQVGTLAIDVLHVPGHTLGHLAFLVRGQAVFTGDALFRGSVGGTRGPAHATFENLRHSVIDVLMRLAAETIVWPGHAGATTIGAEWGTNPFVRAWRGIDTPQEVPCRAFGEPAQLLLRAPDYDGGTKCWVRYQASDRFDVVPGSSVVDLAG